MNKYLQLVATCSCLCFTVTLTSCGGAATGAEDEDGAFLAIPATLDGQQLTLDTGVTLTFDAYASFTDGVYEEGSVTYVNESNSDYAAGVDSDDFLASPNETMLYWIERDAANTNRINVTLQGSGFGTTGENDPTVIFGSNFTEADSRILMQIDFEFSDADESMLNQTPLFVTITEQNQTYPSFDNASFSNELAALTSYDVLAREGSRFFPFDDISNFTMTMNTAGYSSLLSMASSTNLQFELTRDLWPYEEYLNEFLTIRAQTTPDYSSFRETITVDFRSETTGNGSFRFADVRRTVSFDNPNNPGETLTTSIEEASVYTARTDSQGSFIDFAFDIRANEAGYTYYVRIDPLFYETTSTSYFLGTFTTTGSIESRLDGGDPAEGTFSMQAK